MSAWVGAVDVPVARDLTEPSSVARRHHEATTDGSLSALLIAVQQLDRERLALGHHPHELGVQRFGLITDRAFPVTRAVGRDVQVDRQPSELIEFRAGYIGVRHERTRIPTVQQRKPGADVAQADRKVDLGAIVLVDRSPAAEVRDVLIAPDHLLVGVAIQRRHEHRAHPSEEGALGNPRRPVRRSHRGEGRNREYERPTRGSER